MDKKPLFKESAQLLSFWSLNPLNNSKFSIIAGYLPLFLCTTFSFEVCLGLFKNLDMKNLVFSTACFIGCWQCWVKIFVIILQRKNIASLLKTMHLKYWKFETLDPNLQEHLNKIYKLFRRFIIGAIVLFWLTIAMYMVDPPLIKQKILPVPLYHFIIDDISLPVYIFAIIYELIMLLLIGTPCFMGFDFLLGAIIIYHINELFLIKEKFLLVAHGDSERNNLEMLRNLTKHQNLVLSCIQRTNTIYARFFFNAFFTNIFTTCLCLINIVAEGFPPDYKNIAQAFATLSLFLSTLFLYCFLGTLLTTEAENIGNSIYNSDWLQGNKIELRRQLPLIIQRSQNVTKLSAGPLMDLNLESFGRIIGTAFNFFTLAEALFNK